MKTKSNAGARRGRPQLYPLTSREIGKINTRLGNGVSVAKIAQELGVNPYAVLRIKRGANS